MNTRPYKPYAGRKRNRVLCLLLALVLAAVVALGSLAGYIFVHSKTQLLSPPQVMVIFGCQVKEDGPSQTLQDRLDAALDYLSTHNSEEILIVVSGGQGDNEPTSEAQAMYDYLTAHGVDGGAILQEDRSRNTWQNIQYTQALLREEAITAEDFLLVSSGFHLSRIKLLWQRSWGQTERVSTLAAPVTHRPTAAYMFLREPLALVKSTLFDR